MLHVATVPFQTGPADLDTLAEPLRIIILVVLRDAHSFFPSVFRLLCEHDARPIANAVRTLRLGNCMAPLLG